MFVARRDGLLRAVATVFVFLAGGICDSFRQRDFLAGFRFAVLSFA
jgi:hypothetical protein